MSDIPKTPEAVRRIWESYESDARQSPRRTHMGASILGHECERYVWFSWRWVHRTEFSGRMLRLFETGHKEEERVVRNLRRIGAEVLDVDPSGGRQWRLYDPDFGEHVAGSMDGVGQNIPGVNGWCLLEFKTSNKKAFARLRKHGVRLAKSQHYDQMQLYMSWAELPRAVYMTVCKDTDDLHFEVVEPDADRVSQLKAKAHRIFHSSAPPLRVSDSTMPPSPCAWCDFKDHCHNGAVADVTCRTCVHATPKSEEPGARWMCDLTGEFLTSEAQQRACDEHLFIPDLIPWAAPQDAGDGWVRYSVRGKDVTFLNVAATGFPGTENDHLSSRQLSELQPSSFDGTPEEWELFPDRKAG